MLRSLPFLLVGAALVPAFALAQTRSAPATAPVPVAAPAALAPVPVRLSIPLPGAPAPVAVSVLAEAPLASIGAPSLVLATPASAPLAQARAVAVAKVPARAPGRVRGALADLRRAGEALVSPFAPKDPAATLRELFGERAGRAFEEAPPAAAGDFGGRRAGPKSGLDLSAIERGARPQDDFFRFANGAWLASYRLPADKTRFGSFDRLSDRSEEAVRDILAEAARAPGDEGSDRRRIADLYRSFMDEDAVEAKGLAPLARRLKAIDAIRTKESLPKIFARGLAEGGASPVGFGVGQDSKEPTRHIAGLGQAGLGLPDRDYYFQEGAEAETIRSKYREYLAELFTLAGERDAKAKASAVFALEKALAAHHWTNVENRDADKTYNKLAVPDLAALAPGFDWRGFLRAAGLPRSERHVDVGQPSYLTGFARVLADRPLEDWKLYLKAHALSEAAPYLPRAFVEAKFAFYGRTLSGQPEMRPRWKRGVSLVDAAVGELIGKLYVERHFPAASKERARRLVEDLRSAYVERIRALPWMGEATKAKALEKLESLAVKIGYPDSWRDYSGLNVAADDLLGNVRRANRFEHRRMLAKLGRPVDRGEWGMNPQEVNAYYHPVMNEIVFPAAILHAPFFDPLADDAANYGAIGAIIGHEMSHGFDDEGSKFDADGALKDWWTAADRAEFERRAARLVAQADAFEALPGKFVNGRLTLGENIADLGGLIVAYRAYRLSLRGAEPPVIDGLTGDQRFFLGYAQAWMTAQREESAALQMATDPHAPESFRVNGVLSNFAPFYEAFGVEPGDKLHKPESDRVAIW